MLFSTFLWRPLHDHDVKPNLKFNGGRGHATTNFPRSFWTWIKSLRIQLQEKSPCIWHIERVQIDAIKFERTQTQFFKWRFHCRCRRHCFRSLITASQRCTSSTRFLRWYLRQREDRGWKIDIKRSDTHRVKIPRPFSELWGLFQIHWDEQGNDFTDWLGNRATREERNWGTGEPGNGVTGEQRSKHAIYEAQDSTLYWKEIP